MMLAKARTRARAHKHTQFQANLGRKPISSWEQISAYIVLPYPAPQNHEVILTLKGGNISPPPPDACSFPRQN